MKKAFNKYAEELPDEEVSLFNDLVRVATPHLKINRDNVLEFLHKDLAPFMAEAIHCDVYKVLKSRYILTRTEIENLEDSIAEIINYVQIKYNKQMDRVNKGRIHRNPDVFSIAAYHPRLLDRLANDMNATMRYAAVLIAETAMAVHDVTLVRTNWQELYYEPVSFPKEEIKNVPETRDIAEIMFLDTHEVYDYLNGYFSCRLYQDVSRLCPNLTRDQREKFFYAFDDLMDEIKDYYSDMAADIMGQGIPNSKDPAWRDITKHINVSMEAVSPAICALLVAAHDKPICKEDLKLLVP